MHPNILAAPSAVCNISKSVGEFSRVFFNALKYAADNFSDRELKRDCESALAALIEHGSKAIRQVGSERHLISSKTHLCNYIYHASIYHHPTALIAWDIPRLRKFAQKMQVYSELFHNNKELNQLFSGSKAAHQNILGMAISLAYIFIIAEDCFLNLSYPRYYNKFRLAVDTLCGICGVTGTN